MYLCIFSRHNTVFSQFHRFYKQQSMIFNTLLIIYIYIYIYKGFLLCDSVDSGMVMLLIALTSRSMLKMWTFITIHQMKHQSKMCSVLSISLHQCFPLYIYIFIFVIKKLYFKYPR